MRVTVSEPVMIINVNILQLSANESDCRKACDDNLFLISCSCQPMRVTVSELVMIIYFEYLAAVSQ